MAPQRHAGGQQIIPRPADWTPGPPSPWRAVDGGRDVLGAADVLARLAPYTERRPLEPPSGARNAAVLVALQDGPHGAEVLLTRRSWNLSTHRGEIAFPGGRMEPGETPLVAAEREAHEEVCLDPALVEEHGELDHLATIQGRSYIIPVLARLTGPAQLHPGTSEVERILFVPLVDLARPGAHREERWGANGRVLPIQFFELADETIWGATARVLTQMLTLLYLG